MNRHLEDRIHASLIGAAAGAELGFARAVKPERFAVAEPQAALAIKLQPVGKYQPDRNRSWHASAAPFVDVAVRAYLARGGRVTPEDFGAVFKRDKGIAAPDFALDNFHNVQELLQEGMNPRLSGLGNALCGLLGASTVPVGLFHFADPDRAYLDGVELASVAQPRLGADWAALCAAAVAAALAPAATTDSVIETTLRVAHENNKELFYAINGRTRTARGMTASSEEQFLTWWFTMGAKTIGNPQGSWIAYNPIEFVLPLLRRYGSNADAFFRVVLAPKAEGFTEWMVGGHVVSAVVGGAIIGALHGTSAFSPELRKWATPLAKPWFGLAKVIRARAGKETQIVRAIDRAAKKRSGGTDLLRNKVYGNILAGAIGNAMGSPVEGQFYWEIDQKHPGGIQTVLDPSRLESEDDNQMAMHLTETYLQRNGRAVMARHFGKQWRDRLNRDHFFPLCMGNAYDLICQGWDPRIIGHWSVVTGSTVMCLEPVGLFNMADPDWAFTDAMAVAYMYQRGLDMWAAASLAATVAEALRPEATVNSVCQAALDTAPTGPLKTFDKRKFKTFREYLATCLDIAEKYDDVLAARPELYKKCLLYHHIDPLELWGFALAMFKIANGDVRQAAIGGTNIGRDSDTIAGRAAMLAGTLRGGHTVPPEWVKMVPAGALRRIKTNARRFSDLLVGGKLATLKTRQAVAAHGNKKR